MRVYVRLGSGTCRDDAGRMREALELCQPTISASTVHAYASMDQNARCVVS
jgi:hypothetical protein